MEGNMEGWSTDLPPLLAELHEIEVNADPDDDIDFEPFTHFVPADEAADWFSAWTGTDGADASAYRLFGQDGAGGYAAIWVCNNDQGLLEQPIVFFGSEGEVGVVAVNFDAYLWLLADGCGPYEAVAYADAESHPHAQFTAFAKRVSKVPPMSASEVIDNARQAFPDFEDDIAALCE
jgi:hypothetical protein